MNRHIIPVLATNEGAPIVLEVKKHGSRPLDLRLIGCEGENVYVTTIKQRDIRNWKRRGSNEEWETIISHFLLQSQPEGEKAGLLDDVRMEYSPKGDDIQITVRRDVQGIKMTLGEFALQRNSDTEIDPIDWAYTSAQAHNETLKQMAEFRAKVDGEQRTIEKLQAQLDDFIRTKDQTETAMLEQFMGLLNEKKRKIRDQNRLLAGAQLDESKASAIHPRKAGPSRASKRKAPAKAVAEQEEEINDDQMEIDESKAEERDDESGPEAATPDRSDDDETEDEGESGGNAPARRSSTFKSTETPGEKAAVAQSLKPASTRVDPPPKRELPFGRPATRNQVQKQPSPAADDDDDAETEDEEL